MRTILEPSGAERRRLPLRKLGPLGVRKDVAASSAWVDVEEPRVVVFFCVDGALWRSTARA